MVTFCRRKLLWVSSLLLAGHATIFSRQAEAQATQRTSYTLPALIDSAEHYLPVLMQKKALIAAAKAGVRDARNTYLPNSIAGEELSVGLDNALPGSYYSWGLIPSVSAGV